MKVLLVGEPNRAKAFRSRLLGKQGIDIDLSDGDSEEDFEDYDVIFDLNFDDDSSNLPIYAALKEKPIFVSAVKQSLSEAVYEHQVKVKCCLFGINPLTAFVNDLKWELSFFRRFESSVAEKVLSLFDIPFLPVEDRVGLVKPRVIFQIINEACYTLQESVATIEDIDLSMKLGANYPYGPFEWCDNIGITVVFETLNAIYEDTRDERYKICPLLKHKYLRNETFYRTPAHNPKKEKDKLAF